MNIIAAIIDHNQASLDERELFACSAVQAERLYENAQKHPDIAGAVLLNTCNRTELYLSLRCSEEGIEGADALRDSSEKKHEQKKELESGSAGMEYEAEETSGCPDPYVMLCECMNLNPSVGEHLVRRIRQPVSSRKPSDAYLRITSP